MSYSLQAIAQVQKQLHNSLLKLTLTVDEGFLAAAAWPLVRAGLPLAGKAEPVMDTACTSGSMAITPASKPPHQLAATLTLALDSTHGRRPFYHPQLRGITRSA